MASLQKVFPPQHSESAVYQNPDDEVGGRVYTQIGPWAMVPVWVLKYLKGAEVAVYVSLRSFADREGHGYPRTKTIAERAGVAVNTVRNAIQKMRRHHLVTTAERRRADGSVSGLDYYLCDVDPETPDGGGGTPRSDQSPPGDINISPAQDSSLDQGTRVTSSSDARTHQKNTPKPPPPTSSINAAVENGEGLTEEEEFSQELKNFVKNLDYGHNVPSRNEYVRIAKAAKHLYGHVPAADLKTRLQANIATARSHVAVYIQRLHELTPSDFTQQKKKKTAPTWAVPWCGDCVGPDRRITYDENGYLTGESCPRCAHLAATGGLPQ